MVIIEEANAILFNLNDPGKVLDAISTARKFHWKNTDLVAVPYGVDEVRVLRNLGFEVPLPILRYYDWPGRYTPYHHQKETAAFLTKHKQCLVLNEIGTGKSLSALWAADYLMREKLVGKVLILSPLSTLESVWGDELFFTFPDRTHAILHGTAKKRLDLLEKGYDFNVINHDGFGIIADAAHGMFDLVIIDEAAVYRNIDTNRFKNLVAWLKSNPHVRLWLMTGTPTPNAPTDAYALGRLVDSPYTQRPFGYFKDQTMKKVSMYRWVPKPEATEIVHLALTPSIRFSRDECFDLPETVVETRTAQLTGEQLQVYNTMLKKFVAEVSDTTISAQNEAIKIGKLLQIACGVAYDDSSENVAFDCSPRLRVVKEVTEQAGGKVIVFAPWRGVLEMIVEALSKHWTTALVHGNVNRNARTAIFRDFQQKEEPQVLVAHPGTMAHGLTLTKASTIIWYGPMYSNEIYQQANGRIERIGKTLHSTVVHIEATRLEHEVYTRLQGKQKLQGALLDLVKDSKFKRQ